MAGKRYQQLKEKVPTQALGIEEAVAWLKKEVVAKADPTIEVHVHLGINPEKSDQMVRGNLTLPAGTPKQKRIAVIVADPGKQTQAKAAGAVLVGGGELIAQIEQNKGIEAEVIIATPDMMPKIAKVAKILGPQGLMPNPKTGTVSPDPAAVVKDLNSGKAMFKMDTLGNIHEVVGKLSWEADRLVVNIKAVIEAIRAAKPSSVKGQYIKTVTVKTTMSPALKISL